MKKRTTLTMGPTADARLVITCFHVYSLLHHPNMASYNSMQYLACMTMKCLLTGGTSHVLLVHTQKFVAKIDLPFTSLYGICKDGLYCRVVEAFVCSHEGHSEEKVPDAPLEIHACSKCEACHKANGCCDPQDCISSKLVCQIPCKGGCQQLVPHIMLQTLFTFRLINS